MLTFHQIRGSKVFLFDFNPCSMLFKWKWCWEIFSWEIISPILFCFWLGLTATSLYIVDHLCSTYPSLPRLGVRYALKENFYVQLVNRNNFKYFVGKNNVTCNVLYCFHDRCFHDFLVGRRTIVKLCNQISLPDLIRLEVIIIVKWLLAKKNFS